MVRGKKNISSKKLSKSCEFLKKNWHIITGVVVILAILIIVIVYVSKSNREMFSDDDKSPSVGLFHAPWCGHCKKLKPTWDKLKSDVVLNSKDQPVKIVDVNCDENKDIAKKHGIDGFPTIKYFSTGMGKSGKVYDGNRDLQSIKTFINNQ